MARTIFEFLAPRSAPGAPDKHLALLSFINLVEAHVLDGIPTAIIAERYKAGESIDQLADDYGRERLDIEEAIRCKLERARRLKRLFSSSTAPSANA